MYGDTKTYEDKKHKIEGYGYLWQYILGTERYAVNPNSFSYKIDGLKSGYWSCTLSFAETYWSSPGQRIFKIEVNGQYRTVDILKYADKYNSHYEYFNHIYVDEYIKIKFHRKKNDPTISAIQCYRY